MHQFGLFMFHIAVTERLYISSTRCHHCQTCHQI